jgi:uncharacterized protein YbjT (DUF2867 family)
VFLLATGGIGQAEAEINVVNAARAAGVRRIVKLSVWRAGDAGYAMAGIHRTVERAIEESGLGWTFLRATGFMQNFVTHLGGSIRATGRIFQPAGDARLSHIDVRDIAAVAAEVLTTDSHAGKIYELSGPEALSYGDAAAILSRVLDKRLEYVAVTDDAARATLLSAGVPAAYADMVIDLYRYYRTGAVATVSTAVKDITGRDPIRFEQFARDHLSAFVG